MFRFDSGKAEAFQILMKIFEEKRDTNFSSIFLACFYQGLQQALVKNVYLVGIILNCTKSLFQLVIYYNSCVGVTIVLSNLVLGVTR